MTLTTSEAAALVGVTPFTIRQWVARGYLAPVRFGARPMLFHEFDVTECWLERLPVAWHRRLDDLSHQWRVACAADEELSR